MPHPLYEKLYSRKLGKPDVIVLFIQRMKCLLNGTGTLGTLATQSITEVDSKRLFDAVVLDDASIFKAVSSRPWPGVANVYVSEIWLTRRPWRGQRMLDERLVSEIGAELRPGGARS